MPASMSFSDDGAPVRSPQILRNALAYAGMAELPVVDHAEDAAATEGAEANDGFVATVLGLRGWPASAEVSAVARPGDPRGRRARRPGRAAPPHAHLSTAGALDLVRRARQPAARHLRRDAAPPCAERRMACRCAALGLGRDGDPWADGALERRHTTRRCGSARPLRSPGDAAAVRSPRSSTAPPTRWQRITLRTPRSTRPSNSDWPRTGSAGSRRHWGCSSQRSTRATCRSHGRSPR